MPVSISLVGRLRRLSPELVRFSMVGSLGYVVDVGLFNLLRYDGGGWPGPLEEQPLLAKALSMVAATVVTYLGNRHWTWGHGVRRGAAREYAVFFVLNGIGMLIALGCLFVSHYVLGFTSALADNIAANGVGLVLGATFRFWSYRTFVFLR
ncbi:MAG: GtrA family protein [Actinomycetota bacterium]|jgi:putative flippase GtrA|nr:GtrA family protein [Actinomycetota bacterium]